MKTKIMLLLLGITGFVLTTGVYAVEIDKPAMDAALRQELSQINDIEMRQAILDEYKNLIREKIPEINLDEATCQQCEEDIKVMEKQYTANAPIDNGINLKEKDVTTEKQTVSVNTETVAAPRVEVAIATTPRVTETVQQQVQVVQEIQKQVEKLTYWSPCRCDSGSFEPGKQPAGWVR